MKTAFYCVADARYFLGAVGLVNSLRLVGHTEPIFLLDCGLTEPQRELLGDQVTLVQAPHGIAPWLLKTIIPVSERADVAVLIDTDMIITRPMDALVELARGGGVVAIRDPQQRFFARWGELLDLGEAQPIPYVSSGLVLFGGDEGMEILDLLHDRQPRVDFELTFWGRNVRDYPFLYADQDVLNAILSTRRGRTRLDALDTRLAATPPFRGLRVIDQERLECAYRDGTRPHVIHQYLRKPWLEATYNGVYSQLLRRLLEGDDVALTPDREDVPVRMRTGRRAKFEQAKVNVTDFLRWHLGDRLPGPIATRVEDLRRTREARGL